MFLIFSLIESCISSVYSISYQSLYPKLIPEGMSQKGYTVSSMIYPTVTIIASPLGSLLYTKVGIGPIVIAYGFLLWIASFFEHFIDIHEETTIHSFDFKQYLNDMKSTLQYFKEEKGIRYTYMAMPFSQGFSEGTEPLIMAYFSSTPTLGITLYSFFTVSQFIGRTLGGIVNYKIEYPKEKRFSICYFVYIFYSIMDGILLLLPYPFMLLDRALSGFCGINSATLRESSVQNYIPDDKHFENYDDVVINLYILCLTDFRKYIEDRIEGSESEEGIRKMSYAFLDYLEKYSNRYEVVLKSKHFMHPLVREEDDKLIGNLLHFLDSYCRNREDIINASRIYRSMIAGFAFYESKGLFSLPMVTTRTTFDILINNYISYLKSIKTDSHPV